MSAAITHRPAVAAEPRSGLTFGGILNSEWIKLRTLRSTMWCYLILIVVTIGLTIVVSLASGGIDNIPENLGRSMGSTATTIGANFDELVVAVLGALMITGEYGTGMIRSTLTAVPTRTPALIGKTLVFGIVTFVLSLVTFIVSAVLAWIILGGEGISYSLFSVWLLLPILGAAGYLALIGMLSLAFGAIIRNSAGGIAAGLGLILVVPSVLQILGGITRTTWPLRAAQFLPSSAGAQLYTYAHGIERVTNPDVVSLDALQGGLVLGAWVVVLFVLAAVLLKRRDA